MKKNIFFALSIIAAFGFTACSKTELSNQKGSAKTNFSIVAGINSEITKTTNDGLNTNWAADDAINLFHTVAGTTTTYGTNDKFIISGEDLTSGTFKGTLTEELSASNDWYAMYPYSSYISTPANTSGYINIGSSSSSTAQKQEGNDSMAHLAGQYFPLVATAKAIAENDPVSLTFNPILSIVKFHVTNKTTKPLTVKNISVTAAEEDIIGSYYINFAGDPIVFTKSGDSYISKTANLTVNNGDEIAVNSSADFYLAIKPFSNTAGKTLTFTVNGYEKTSTSAITFAPGKIKTVNFSYDKEIKVLEAGTYVALIQNSGTSYFAMSSTDDGATTKRFKSKEITYEGSGKYSTSDASIVWNVTKDEDGYLFENGGKYVSWSSGNSAVMSDDPYYLNVTDNGDYFNVYSVNESSRILSKNSTSAFFAFYGTESQKKDFTFIPAELLTTPVIEPITAPEKVEAAGATGVEVSYSITNPVEGKSVSAVSAETWVNNFNYDTEGKIIFDVDANTSSEERTSEITVSYEGAQDVKFIVTQSGVGAATYTWTLESGQLSLSGGTYTSGKVTWTYGGSSYIGFDSSKGVQIGSSKNPQASFNINTEYFNSKTIKSITVNACMGNSGDAKLSIKVGGTTKLDNNALKTSATDYKADNINASGKIEIVFSATAKAYYLKSITVEYID